MTDSNRSLSELPALVAERRRYEGWLAALAARRDTTAGHVYERVHSDYQTRLDRVLDQLEAHRHIIDEERTSVQSRLSLLEAEEQMRRDERAELDLRAHVGELAGDEATTAFKAVDDALHHLLGEKQTLQARIGELAALLEVRETPPAPTQPKQSVDAAATPTPAAVSPAPAAPAASAGPVAAQARAATPASIANGAERAPKREVTHPAPPQAATPPANGAPVQPKKTETSFDELAFLNTVVGAGDASQTLVAQSRRDASLVRDERAGESLLSGIGNGSTAAPAGEAPLAANVTANVPITLRATASEQTKTLKCNECGGMNYPTEWYCERCGAELAAL
jgi:hypothetical protein